MAPPLRSHHRTRTIDEPPKLFALPVTYAAYVLDPDGNNIELVNHHRT
jgi:hypothetical protein